MIAAGVASPGPTRHTTTRPPPRRTYVSRSRTGLSVACRQPNLPGAAGSTGPGNRRSRASQGRRRICHRTHAASRWRLHIRANAPTRMLAFAVAAVVGLAGCAGGSTTTVAPAPTAGLASPSATPPQATAVPAPQAVTPAPATPEPSPVRWGDAVLVHGTETCMPGNLLIPGPDPSGTKRVRDATITCEMDCDDPRVSGIKAGRFATRSTRPSRARTRAGPRGCAVPRWTARSSSTIHA